jgi:integrase
MARITKRFVDALAPVERETFHWDETLRGFGIRQRPGGSSTYTIQYRALDGRTRRLKIAPIGVMTPEEAREDARLKLAAAARGDDPAGDRQALRRAETVAELCDLYLAERGHLKRASTLDTDTRRIERHIKPLLGRLKVPSVTRADIEKFLRDVANGATAIDERTAAKHGRTKTRGGKGAATRTVGLLSGVFAFAVDRGLRPDNPCHGVKRFADRKNERFLSPKELATLGDAMREAEASGDNAVALAAIRLLILTGCRKGEIVGLRWGYVDWEASCLRLPESKTGQKVVPLGAAALEVLRGLRGEDGRKADAPVFPGAGKAGVTTAVGRTWTRVRKLAGLLDVRIHDLRHSFASVGAAGGNSLPIIGALLGHRDTKTTQRYAHLADDPLKAAAEAISEIEAPSMEGIISALGARLRNGLPPR